jgi:putative oligomerization/nucleic acid binding protein
MVRLRIGSGVAPASKDHEPILSKAVNMFALTLLIVLGTSIWVVVDAKSLGFGRRQLYPGRVDAGPWVWFFACLGLWIVAFPVYLVKRGKYKRLSTEPLSKPVPYDARSSDPITQIERLAQLKERGAISEEEFLTQKKSILGWGGTTYGRHRETNDRSMEAW